MTEQVLSESRKCPQCGSEMRYDKDGFSYCPKCDKECEEAEEEE